MLVFPVLDGIPLPPSPNEVHEQDLTFKDKSIDLVAVFGGLSDREGCQGEEIDSFVILFLRHLILN